jgi:hypothetical protein
LKFDGGTQVTPQMPYLPIGAHSVSGALFP